VKCEKKWHLCKGKKSTRPFNYSWTGWHWRGSEGIEEESIDLWGIKSCSIRFWLGLNERGLKICSSQSYDQGSKPSKTKTEHLCDGPLLYIIRNAFFLACYKRIVGKNQSTRHSIINPWEWYMQEARNGSVTMSEATWTSNTPMWRVQIMAETGEAQPNRTRLK
jgi:hypothetical protein